MFESLALQLVVVVKFTTYSCVIIVRVVMAADAVVADLQGFRSGHVESCYVTDTLVYL